MSDKPKINSTEAIALLGELATILEVMSLPAKAAECREAAKVIKKQSTFIRQVLATQIGYTPFICGEAGEKDRNEMPESFHICPAYGSDVVYIYRKEKSTGQEW